MLIFAATWGVFYSARHGEFLAWDDDINITGNPHIRGLTFENVRWMFTDTEYVRRYIPLGWLGWAAQYQFLGENAAAYHLGNVLLHSLSAVLLLLIMRRLLLQGLPPTARDRNERAALVCAGVAALLWAIHPLRVEPVAWASGRLYCQGVLLVLVSLFAYLRYLESREAGKPSWIWFWSSVAAYGTSLLTYPLALGFLLVLPIVDLWPMRRFNLSMAGLRSKGARESLIEKVAFATLAGLVFAATLWARSNASGIWRQPPTLAEFTVLERVMQGFYVWATCLWRTLVPTDLSPYYTALVQFDALDAPFVASLLSVMSVSVILFWKRRQWRGLVAVWAVYLIILVPMLGLTDHPHYVNDRYSYLPSVALAAIVGGVLLTIWQRSALRVMTLTVAAVSAIIYGWLSVEQIKAWRDTDSLLNHIIAKMGDSPLRAQIYCRIGDRRVEDGMLKEAEQFFKHATRAAPTSILAHRRLGEALILQGRKHEAVDVFVKVLSLGAVKPEMQVYLAELLTETGRYEEALRYYRSALEDNSGYAAAMNGLAWLLATCPDERLRNGKQAVELAEIVSEGTGHRLPMVEATLAVAYRQAGAFDRALKTAERAVTLAADTGDQNQIAHCARVLEWARR